ncbi:hypothetical protein CBFG_03195 [Clostridiales bacterium 1_7_47FAA]|nr:hypothetical protein CBFG_03195 [Clostridiales bacterium 1_7_47FAA]
MPVLTRLYHSHINYSICIRHAENPRPAGRTTCLPPLSGDYH